MDDGMERRGARDRGRRWSVGVGLIVVALGLAACSAAPSPSPSVPPSTAPSLTPSLEPSLTPSLTPTPTVGPTATPGPETLSEKDIAFDDDHLMARGLLDVYWPVAPGPWPVAVMFHGGSGNINKSYLSVHATKVAQLGYVVFVPNQGFSGGADFDALQMHEKERASGAQSACAVAFAAREASKFGGDPTWITIFGHSSGANEAAKVAFQNPEPSAACFADTKAEADVLITWEGDWLMAGTPSFWDPIHAADPEEFDAVTPWAHIASRPELRVIMLESENNGLGRDAKDSLGPDGWLTVRDPTAAFTAALKTMGAFDDGDITLHESETLLADRLKASGNLVSFDIMPGSTHESLSPAGWEVFLDAFRRVAALAG